MASWRARPWNGLTTRSVLSSRPEACPFCQHGRPKVIDGASGRSQSKRPMSTQSIERHSAKNVALPDTLRKVVARTKETNENVPNVRIKGWIRRIRRHGKLVFVDISDGTLQGGEVLQAVFKGSHRDLITSTWTAGAAVQIQGLLKKGRNDAVELEADSAILLAPCDSATFPLQTMPSIEMLRKVAHLRFRRERDAAVLRARDRIEYGIATWFKENDFVQVTAPVITGSDCEGAGEVFQVCADAELQQQSSALPASKVPPSHAFWSGVPAYLTVSSQLHLEALSLALSRVWTFTPAFRAEHSATNRHLAEFRMCEAELAFTDSLADVLDCVQGIVTAAIQSLFEGEVQGQESHQDMRLLYEESSSMADVLRGYAHTDGTPWPRISYTEALSRLQQHFGNDSAPEWGDSISSEHERWLASEIGRGPLFVTDYPASIKPFYMRVNESNGTGDNRQTVACFDLLVPGIGELAGGSLREEREGILKERMAEAHMSAGTMEKLQWYTEDLRRYGGVAHGGFGLGMERLVSWITQTDNVRDCVPFPRAQGRVRF